jgi:hypothetical protein
MSSARVRKIVLFVLVALLISPSLKAQKLNQGSGGFVPDPDFPEVTGLGEDFKQPSSVKQPGNVIMSVNSNQRTMEALKTALGCTEEEWSILMPKVRLVQQLRWASGLPGGIKTADASVKVIMDTVRARQEELMKAVADNATALDLAPKLAALRDAKTKAREELARVAKELAGMLTVRQEAILVEKGLLE